jgi:hypothetical protein
MQQRPVSVTIFGILNIGFGLLDLLVTLFLMVILPGMRAAGNSILKQMPDNPWTRISMPLDGIAAVVLMAAGIGLLLLQNWARITSIIYGAYSILSCIVGTIVTLGGGPFGFMMIAKLTGSIVSLVYPVVLIIFMLRPKIVAALKPAQPAV